MIGVSADIAQNYEMCQYCDLINTERHKPTLGKESSRLVTPSDPGFPDAWRETTSVAELEVPR